MPARLAEQFAYGSAYYLFAVLLVAGCLATYWAFTQMQAGPKIVPFEKQWIDVDAMRPEAALTGKNVAVGRGEGERIASGMQKASEWMLQGLEAMRLVDKGDGKPDPDPTQRFVVLKSKMPFQENYSKITGRITLATNLKIEEGILFLRSVEGDRPVYRQMACNCDITAAFNGATFELYSPRANEEAIAILRLRHLEGGEVSGEPGTYGITMEVNNE